MTPEEAQRVRSLTCAMVRATRAYDAFNVSCQKLPAISWEVQRKAVTLRDEMDTARADLKSYLDRATD